MPVIYDGNKIIPGPTVSITKNYNRLGNEESEIVSSNYEIVLNGTIVAFKGSPNSSGIFWDQSGYPEDENISIDSRLGAVLRKQKALRTLFSKENEGKALEIQSDDGSQPLKMYPNILSISFPEGLWHTICPYTITLSANQIFPLEESFLYNISSASESWSLEPQDTPENFNVETNNSFQTSSYYRLGHNVSAQGIRVYDDLGNILKQPWESAKEWVISRLGINQQIVDSSGVNNIPSYYTGKDHFRTEEVDQINGSYSVNESWLLTSGNAIEDFTVSITSDISNPYTVVDINGSIRGLEEKDSNMTITKTRYENASEYYETISSKFFSRAQTIYDSNILNSLPINTNIGRNPANGTINYSFQYNSRPSGIIEGALSENINVSYTDGGESFASVFAIGRSKGPVLQALGTAEAKTKTLSIDAVFNSSLNPDNLIGSFSFPESKVSDIVEQLNPINEGAVKSFKSPASKNWSPITGQLSYSVTWTYED
jgi:hypothetical protein